MAVSVPSMVPLLDTAKVREVASECGVSQEQLKALWKACVKDGRDGPLHLLMNGACEQSAAQQRGMTADALTDGETTLDGDGCLHRDLKAEGAAFDHFAML
eukprot:6208585-Pleurochrysis_carterae.AAC.6